VLLESTLGKLSSDRGAKKFLNVEMEQKILRKHGRLKKLQSSGPTDLHRRVLTERIGQAMGEWLQPSPAARQVLARLVLAKLVPARRFPAAER